MKLTEAALRRIIREGLGEGDPYEAALEHLSELIEIVEDIEMSYDGPPGMRPMTAFGSDINALHTLRKKLQRAAPGRPTV